MDAKAVVQQFHEAAFDRLDPTAVDRLCAPHYVLHDPAFPGGAGRDLTKRLITTLRTGVPDVTHAWEDRMVVGDKSSPGGAPRARIPGTYSAICRANRASRSR